MNERSMWENWGKQFIKVTDKKSENLAEMGSKLEEPL